MIAPVLTTSGLARLLGVNDRTVRRWIDSGEIPAAALRFSKGGKARILTAQLVTAGWLPAEAVRS